MFSGAVRTADWDLHLKALERFTGSFFAHDRLNYAKMVPFYLYIPPYHSTECSRMGNWIVNKNPIVQFVGLVQDNAR